MDSHGRRCQDTDNTGKDTMYRAVFESPYKVSNMEITGYELPSTGDDWYLDLSATLVKELPNSHIDVNLRVYDGEIEDDDKLLGECEDSFSKSIVQSRR